MVRVADERVASDRLRATRAVLDELDASARREQTPIIQEFEHAAGGAIGLVRCLVPGPSHETSLPRRPPCHWLRPPRESVVIALLPWHARTAGRLDSGADSPDAGSRLDQ